CRGWNWPVPRWLRSSCGVWSWRAYSKVGCLRAMVRMASHDSPRPVKLFSQNNPNHGEGQRKRWKPKAALASLLQPGVMPVWSTDEKDDVLPRAAPFFEFARKRHGIHVFAVFIQCNAQGACGDGGLDAPCFGLHHLGRRLARGARFGLDLAQFEL